MTMTFMTVVGVVVVVTYILTSNGSAGFSTISRIFLLELSPA